jgi:hypothetical protein
MSITPGGNRRPGAIGYIVKAGITISQRNVTRLLAERDTGLYVPLRVPD